MLTNNKEVVMGVMCKLDGTGDTKVMWDPQNEDEVEVAEEQFDALIERGFTAYAVKKDGEKGRKITKFDAKAGKIIMVPGMQGG